MMFLSHTLGGAAAGAWLAVAVRPTPTLALVGTAVGALGSMAPDCDHPGARPARALGPVGWVLTRVLRLISKVLTGTRHRGITHSLLFAVLVGCGVALLAYRWVPAGPAAYLGAAAVLGVVAALLGDLVTRAGLRHLLWPARVQVSVPRVLRIKTGGRVEKWVVLPVTAGVAAVGLGLVLGGPGA